MFLNFCCNLTCFDCFNDLDLIPLTLASILLGTVISIQFIFFISIPPLIISPRKKVRPASRGTSWFLGKEVVFVKFKILRRSRVRTRLQVCLLHQAPTYYPFSNQVWVVKLASAVVEDLFWWLGPLVAVQLPQQLGNVVIFEEVALHDSPVVTDFGALRARKLFVWFKVDGQNVNGSNLLSLTGVFALGEPLEANGALKDFTQIL